MRPPIAFLGLELETPALEASAAFYGDQFGLEPIRREEGLVVLATTGAEAPSLVLRRADSARLAALRYAYPDRRGLDEAHASALATGLSPQDEDGGFAVVSPDGTRIVFSVGTDASVESLQPAGDKPLFMSHVVVNSRQPERLVSFFRDRLGFMVSDRYEKGLLTFLKCGQPQHHCLGVAPAETDGLNHFAMDCGTIDALMRGLSRMKALGHAPIWGPGRHGPGGNVFCYFEDPTGFVAEYTCEVIQIADDATWQPTEWRRTPENGNVWHSGGPSPRAVSLMSGEGLDGSAHAGRAAETME